MLVRQELWVLLTKKETYNLTPDDMEGDQYRNAVRLLDRSVCHKPQVNAPKTAGSDEQEAPRDYESHQGCLPGGQCHF